MKARAVNLNKESYDVYAGRGKKGKVPQTPGEYGWLGNPYTVEKFGDQAVPMFKDYFYSRLMRDEKFRGEVLKCSGKSLGCFCDEGCHAEVIAEFLNRVEDLSSEYAKLDSESPN